MQQGALYRCQYRHRPALREEALDQAQVGDGLNDEIPALQQPVSFMGLVLALLP